MNPSQRLDSKTARHALTDNPHYRYRGCAPDPDQPAVAAGNNTLPITAWEPPDVDGGEPQADRIAREKAAIEVCVDCPVMVQCLAYGSSVTRSGKLAEPHAILGGMTALERHKALVKERQQQPAPVVPDGQLRTKQKLAVLAALAAHTDPEAVAAAAGMDVRTANWQRSILVGKLGLPRTASRRQLLDAATAHGLLDGVDPVADDGTVPAIPAPGTSTPTQQPAAAEPAEPAHSIPAPAAASQHDASEPAAAHDAARARTARRGRFTCITGQLTLDDLATVLELPTRIAFLEAAA